MAFRIGWLTLLCVVGWKPLQAQLPVGAWRDHLPYDSAKELTYCGSGGETGFWAVRTPRAVFVYRMEDHTLNTWSKVTGLSGSNPTALAWDASEELLLIGYADGLIDWVAPDGTVVFTLTDIRDSNLIGSKAINRFGPGTGVQNLTAACGFGVVFLDLRGRYVLDTWYPEGSGNPLNVWDIVLHDGTWNAATDRGIFQADVTHPFLSAPDAWTRWSDIPMELGDYRNLAFSPTGEAIVHWYDVENAPSHQLWVQTDGLWQPLPGYDGSTVRAITTAEIGGAWRLAVADWNSVHQFDANLEFIRLDYNAAGVPLRVNRLVYHGGVDEEGNAVFRDLYIANDIDGLVRLDVFDGPRDAHWAPDGPPVSAVRQIDCWNDDCWIASGGVDGAWTNLYYEHGMFGLLQDKWVHLPAGEGSNSVLGVRDFMTVSIDPTDPTHVCFGSWEDGVFEVRNGQISSHFTPINSTLSEADFGGSPRTGVGGLDFDQEGNLWVTNAFAEHPLHVLTAEGEWASMDVGNALGTTGFLEHILAARNGYIWSVIPRGGGLFVYDPAGTPSDTSDDDWRILTKENAGLPSNMVISLEEDLDGEIWVGTEKGPAVVYLPSAVFESGGDGNLASQILIQQDGNYQFLLETEIITSICIDGGNRKWLGTQTSGAYLIEADGLGQVEHFTSTNSPLLSDNVFDIAINHRTGEVFFGTEKGVVSWLGEATNFVRKIDELLIYPNPVRDDHEGPITLDGCAFGSVVQVTDAGGRWIATLESEGGRAIWDGLDEHGQPVPMGIYLFFATDANGKSAGVTKLAITRSR